MDKKYCVSCKKDISNMPGSVEFPCPGCGKELVVRCGRCRKLSADYKCKCGFEGP